MSTGRSARAGCSALVESTQATGIVTLVIAGAFVFNYIIATEQIPNLLGAWLASLELDPTLFLLLVTIVFLLLGACSTPRRCRSSWCL